MGILPATSADTNAPSSNTAAVVTYAGVGGVTHVIQDGQISWGYNGAPTGGSVRIAVGGVVVFGPIPVTAAGAGFMPIPYLLGSPGQAMVATLEAGGSGVSGVLSVLGHRTV